jgi:hypothetical protein
VDELKYAACFAALYKKVMTSKGNAALAEFRVRIKKLLEFDVEYFPTAASNTRNVNGAAGAWSHTRTAYEISVAVQPVQQEPANQSSGDEEILRLEMEILRLKAQKAQMQNQAL